MKYRTLGKTGLEVSAVSIVMWAIGGDAWGPVNDEDSMAAMRNAFYEIPVLLRYLSRIVKFVKISGNYAS